MANGSYLNPIYSRSQNFTKPPLQTGRWTSLSTGTRSETKRKLDLTGASEMNRLYPNSRRESGNENQYLNTLPRRDGGRRKKRPDENETKIRYAGRNGGAQGRGA
ncbi:hypothetical protein TNCV_3354001 [Trichonephila clavipes]|nr:hypothetical protein TNCV_3354001 [Trichonephila clavipes]